MSNRNAYFLLPMFEPFCILRKYAINSAEGAHIILKNIIKNINACF